MLLGALLAASTLVGPCAQPNVRCPDLTMRRPSQFHLLRSRRGRQLLASTNQIVNIGEGPLEIRARRISDDDMAARQVLRGGAPTVLPRTGTVELYDTGTRGTYWKYEGAARFTLHPLSPSGRVEPQARRIGPKLDYCFRDLFRLTQLGTGRPYRGSPRAMVHGPCSQDPSDHTVTLGTSVGWTDSYPWDYPQNWIDVTGLKGCFLYEQTVDPFHQLVELDETDNTGRAIVRLPWHGPGARGCPAPLG